MLTWLFENLATIIITLILNAVAAGIILKLRKDRKKGKSVCGGCCGQCGLCHKE